MKKRIDFGYFVVEGARSIVSHRLMSFAAVCMIVACLLLELGDLLVRIGLINVG